MTDEPRNMPDDLLEKAIAARRDMETPLGPPPPLLAATIQRLKAGDQSRTFSLKWSLSTMRTVNKLAVAAVLAVTLTGLCFVFFHNPGMAFADVLKKVTTAKCVSFKGSETINTPGRPAMQMSMQAVITESGRMRLVMEPGGMIAITDMHEGKLLMLMPALRRASMLSMTNQPAAQTQVNLLTQMKALNAQSGTPIGAREIAGHKTQGFRVVTAPFEMTLWADVETHLPVLIEETLKMAFMPPTTMTMSDFVWNAQIDESLLSLTPPEGYTVQTTTMNMAPATEKDLLESLKTAASFNEGRFPDTFDMTGVISAVSQTTTKSALAKLRKGATTEQIALEDTSAQAMSVISRGWMFVSEAKNGEDWHYAGKGVDLGKAGTPILWYCPKGSANYRVIDADLTVHEAPANALPDVPSVRMGPPTAPPAPTTTP